MRDQYRQLPGRDTWHFRSDCKNVRDRGPYAWAKTQAEKPTTGELCNECLAKERRDSRRR